MTGDRSCSTCAAWARDAGGEKPAGECRRHAPTIAPHNGRRQWPRTLHSDWCAERVGGVAT